MHTHQKKMDEDAKLKRLCDVCLTVLMLLVLGAHLQLRRHAPTRKTTMHEETTVREKKSVSRPTRRAPPRAREAKTRRSTSPCAPKRAPTPPPRVCAEGPACGDPEECGNREAGGEWTVVRRRQRKWWSEC